MDEKIMEDLDPDFINDILGSSELSDNLINELMDELSSSNNPTTTTTTTTNPIPTNNHQHSSGGPDHFNFEHNQIMMNSQILMTSPPNNPVYMLDHHHHHHQNQQNHQQHHFYQPILNMENNTNTTNLLMYPSQSEPILTQPMDYMTSPIISPQLEPSPPLVVSQPTDARRVRKNLKDILAGGQTTNTNTILLNQNSNFIVENHRMIMMNNNNSSYSSGGGGVASQSPQVLVPQMSPQHPSSSNSPSIQIVIENPPSLVNTQPTVGGVGVGSTNQSSPVRKVPSSSSFKSSPSPNQTRIDMSSSGSSSTNTSPVPKTKLGGSMKRHSSSSSTKTNTKPSRPVKLEPDELKMITTPVTLSQQIMDEDDEDEEEDEENECNGGNNKKSHKPHKRTSHNAIERKYRSSINDKISELKARVAGPNVKLQKSGILRKALEHINNIEETNRRLGEENSMLRNALRTISDNVNNRIVIENVLRNVTLTPLPQIPSKAPLSPPAFSLSTPSPSSSSSSSSNGDSSNDATSPPPPLAPQASTKQSYTKKKPAASSASRVVLCALLLSVLVFNPFAWLTDSSSSLDYRNNQPFRLASNQDEFVHGSGRVLNSFADSNTTTTTTIPTESNKFIRTALGWFLNIMLVLVCLGFVYVSGEARVSMSEELRTLLWSRYERAGKVWKSRRSYEESHAQLRLGLTVELGQVCPMSTASLILGCLWQLTRLVIRRLLKLVRLHSLFRRSLDESQMEARRLTALFFYEMHKFAYLNMSHGYEFVPQTLRLNRSHGSTLVQTSNSAAAAAASSMASTSTVTHHRPYMTRYAYLTGVYYLLALYDQVEAMGEDEHGGAREYELCEFYLAMSVFAKCAMPRFMAKRLVRFLVRQKLLGKLEENKKEESSSSSSSSGRMRNLFNKSLFVNFVINFDRLAVASTSRDDASSSTLLGYKRRVLATGFLYDSDAKLFDAARSFNKQPTNMTSSGVAVEYLAAKFKDYVLLKMTKHVIDQSAAVVDANQLISTTRRRHRVVGECERELDDVDRARFDALKAVYTQDLEYVWRGRREEQETHRVLVRFLEMLNQWKLGDSDRQRPECPPPSDPVITNSSKNLFIDAIVAVLDAYEVIKRNQDRPERALELMNKAVESIDAFQIKSNSLLLEKFELLIYDWVLSGQTHLWTHHQIYELELFNRSLSKFKCLIVNYPQLSYKAKMYETVLMFSSNRNPINLVQTNASQFFYSKCNQDAFYSMNSILRQFHLLQL